MGHPTPGAVVAGPVVKRIVNPIAFAGPDMTRPVVIARVINAAAFAIIAVLVVAVTPGVGSIGEIDSWWTSPLAFGKFVLLALLWDLLGLGRGTTPTAWLHSLRTVARLWLRPGTVRLPPWPGKVLATSGTRRELPDVVLFVGVLVLGVALLGMSSDATGTPGLPRTWLWALLLCLGALGVRDRTPFLAARPELYGVLLLVFMFPAENLLFGLKLCLVAIWWANAASRLTRHRPVGPQAGALAAAEFVVPLVLLISRGGLLTVAAVTAGVVLHLLATVPQEWNVVVVYATVVLFGHHTAVGASSLDSPPLVVVLLVLLVGLPVLGNLRPDLLSARMAQRHGSGNDATTVWLFSRGSAATLLDTLAAPLPAARPHPVELLVARTVTRPRDYVLRDGELIADAVLGRALADGHLHGRQLMEAVQQQYGFTSGQLRVVTLESQPMFGDAQAFTVLDAADGLLEAGHRLRRGVVRTSARARRGERFHRAPSRRVDVPGPAASRADHRPRPRPTPAPAPHRPRPRPLATTDQR